MPRAVILTALPVEYLAVRTHLSNLQEEMHPQGTIYERGTFSANGQTWEVGIAEVGAGNAGAAVEAERAIAHFKPDVLLFVGIAGGIKDVAIGDVIAATKVYGYESGKVESQFFTRPTVGQSTYAFVQRARSEARKGEWLQRLSNGSEPQPRVFVAPIAAGEKVIASRESELYQFLRSSYNDAIAVEMEGFGFLSAAFAYPNIQSIVIRGISDLIEDKNAVDPEEGTEEDRQARASQNASAFAFELLRKLQIQSLSNSIEGSANLDTQVLLDKWCKFKINVCGMLHTNLNSGCRSSIWNQVNSPLEELWKDFIECPFWHERLRKKVTQFITKNQRFPEIKNHIDSLRQIDYDREYYSIKLELEGFTNGLIKSIEAREINVPEAFLSGITKDLRTISEALNSPFGKCFLFFGSIGSGKTYSILRIIYGNKNLLPVFLKFHRSSSLQSQILDKINEITGIDWKKSLEAFVAWTGKQTCLKNYKIVLIIDDFYDYIHQTSRSREEFKDDLQKCLNLLSKFENVVWIINLRNINIDLLYRNDDKCLKLDYLSDFTYFQDYFEGFNSSFEEHSKQEFFSRNTCYRDGKQGWLDLDQINYANETGIKIIQAGGITFENCEVTSRPESQYKVTKNLSNPLIACAVLGLRGRHPTNKIVNLNYIELVSSLLDQKLGYPPEEEKLSVEAFATSMGYFISSFPTEVIFEDAEIIIEESDFNGVLDLFGRPDFLNSQDAKIIELLVNHDFLECFTKRDKQSIKQFLRLKFELFWNFYIAESMSQLHLENEKGFNLESCFQNLKAAYTKENIFEFFLLILDRDYEKHQGSIRKNLEIWLRCSSIFPMKSVWIAATKARRLQVKVFEWVEMNVSQIADEQLLWCIYSNPI